MGIAGAAWLDIGQGRCRFLRESSQAAGRLCCRSLRSSFVFLWSKEKKQKSEDQPTTRSIRRATETCAQVAKAQVQKWISTVHDNTAGVSECAQQNKLNLYGNVPKHRLLPFCFGLARCRWRI